LRFFKVLEGNINPDNKFKPQLHVNAFYDLILAKKIAQKRAFSLRQHARKMQIRCK
jgi:hypothetical protein